MLDMYYDNLKAADFGIFYVTDESITRLCPPPSFSVPENYKIGTEEKLGGDLDLPIPPSLWLRPCDWVSILRTCETIAGLY
jgi:hypothetical protein